MGTFFRRAAFVVLVLIVAAAAWVTQSATATDFFAIPSDRVVELGAQVTI